MAKLRKWNEIYEVKLTVNFLDELGETLLDLINGDGSFYVDQYMEPRKYLYINFHKSILIETDDYMELRNNLTFRSNRNVQDEHFSDSEIFCNRPYTVAAISMFYKTFAQNIEWVKYYLVNFYEWASFVILSHAQTISSREDTVVDTPMNPYAFYYFGPTFMPEMIMYDGKKYNLTDDGYKSVD